VPIWEEDFSEVKTAIDELNTQGVTDFRRYLDDHPEFVAQAAQMINVRDVNQATLNMLGAQNKEEVRDSLDKVFAPETLRIFREELIAIAEGKTYFEGETINRTLEGERRNVLLTMAIPTQAEKLDSVLVSTMDITERKRAEEALRESEKKFRTLIENLIDWVWRVDRDGVYTYVSPQAERIMGYSVSEILGKTPFHFMTSQEAERVGAIFSEITAKRERILGLEDTMVTKEGHEIPFETNATPLFDPNGAFIGYMGTCRDITQRKRAEAEVALASEALRRRNRELATLNRASQALVSILDLDQVLVNVLEEVRGLLSVTASSIWLVDPETDELVCQQATGPQNERVRGWRLAPGQGLAGRAARSGQSLIAPDVRADERHFKGVDRQTGLPLRSILTIPLRIKNGVIGVLQVVDTEVDRFDAGDLKLLEPLVTSAAIAIENARLYQQTRRDAETRSALLREVNHRVKNNLTSILGLLYTARDRVQVDERAAYLCTMDALIRRVRGLATAHDLLSASRWAPLRLSDLASRVIHVSLETLPRHKRVSVHVPVSPVRVTADQAHNLALVIGELTTNAAKHALKGRDTACISFQVELEDEDGDDLEHASPMIRCEFRDDGPGYPEEVLALERRNVGFDLIHNIVRKGLRGTLTLHNDGGAVAVIRFEAQVQER
jgi:PAS domain S-box-containing protein